MTSLTPLLLQQIELINERPRQTLSNLQQSFDEVALAFSGTTKVVPVGIEVEVPWRAYFPDLWVDGFPNLDDEQMKAITSECSKREAVLLPKLRQTIHCGIKRGNDRYWEFALDPVTDVSIAVNQVAVLRANSLMPGDANSLHVTLGGLRVSRYSYYIAFVLEALATSPDRVRGGFKSNVESRGWARKGQAGVYEKQGSYDMMHNYNYGTEIRLAQLPSTDSMLLTMLQIAQDMAVEAYQIQCGVLTNKIQFDSFIGELATLLYKAGLPDTNWQRPHNNPEVWSRFAELLPNMHQPVLDVLQKYRFSMQ